MRDQPMEAKSENELLAYVIKMRERGDRFTSIVSYLDRNGADDEMKKRIVRRLQTMEKNHQVARPDRSSKISGLSLFLGGFFFASGIILLLFLWDKGFVAGVPFVLIGIGMFALNGGMK